MWAGTSTLATSTFVCVAATYAWFTRRRGTPLMRCGPATSSSPEASCLRKTTRFPLKRPARRTTTVPGTSDFLSTGARTVLRVLRFWPRSNTACGAFAASTVFLASLKRPRFAYDAEREKHDTPGMSCDIGKSVCERGFLRVRVEYSSLWLGQYSFRWLGPVLFITSNPTLVTLLWL